MVRYTTLFVCFELWIRNEFSWLEATLECGRIPASESCGLLMIGNSHKKDCFSLLDTFKHTTEAQWVEILWQMCIFPRTYPILMYRNFSCLSARLKRQHIDCFSLLTRHIHQESWRSTPFKTIILHCITTAGKAYRAADSLIISTDPACETMWTDSACYDSRVWLRLCSRPTTEMPSPRLRFNSS